MLIENIFMSLNSMRANKLRTFLTMLGIIIGITSVIAIMTVGNSMSAMNREQMSMFGVNTMSVYMWLADAVEIDEETDTSALVPEFTPEMLEKMSEQYKGQIEAIAVQQYVGYGKARIPGNEDENIYAYVNVQGINPGYMKVHASESTMKEGRIFSEEGMDENDFTCVVSDKLCNNLYGGDMKKALGQKLEIPIGESYYTYTITGVYKDNVAARYGDVSSEKDINTNLYIPYRNALTYVDNKNSEKIQYFDAAASDSADVLTLSDELQNYLQSLLPEDTKFQIHVYNNKEWIESSNKALDQITWAIAAIGGIALLVGGIGVMNIMTVSIMERTREIGTRKALGARSRDIRGQFITEAVIMSITGGIIGIFLGILLGYVACRIIDMKMYISYISIILAFSFSFAIGVFFGFYPANRAAKMDPIEALRYE